jgi:hypothetical protein
VCARLQQAGDIREAAVEGWKGAWWEATALPDRYGPPEGSAV